MSILFRTAAAAGALRTRLRRGIAVVLAAAAFAEAASAQGAAVSLTYSGSRNYTLIERTDLRRYDNGKYTGLMSREVRSFISNESTPQDMAQGLSRYDGNFYVLEQTRRSARAVAAAQDVNTAIPAAFTIDREGRLLMQEDNGYPSFRSFPAFSSQKITFGSSWQSEAERAVDPLNKGIVTRMPMLVEYVYQRDASYHGQDVRVISAQWATRYGESYFGRTDPYGDRELRNGTGSHKATIYVSKETGAALLVQDQVDEAFTWSDGNTIAFKGTISLFMEYPPAVDNDSVIRLVETANQKLERKAQQAAREEAARKAQEEALRQEREEAARLAREAAERRAREEAALKAQEEAARKAREEADRLAQENASRKARREAERKAKEEAARLEWERAEQRARELAEQQAAEQRAKELAEQQEREAAEQRERERAALREQEALAKKGGPKTTLGDGRGAGVDGGRNVSGVQPADPPIAVEQTSAGLMLTIRNLQFKPNSAELLPEEEERLDQIVAILKQAPDSQYLVEGHTARIGAEAGEQELSEERAQAIARALAGRGIPAERFICKGSAGRKPVADNSTEAGRARNRRVEITILQ